MADGLTARQRAFAKAYAACFNGAEAARRAGYSQRTAAVQAAQLLAKPKVRALVEEEVGAALERADVRTDQVLAELAAVAFTDPRSAARWDSDSLDLRPSADLLPETAHAVKKVSATTRTSKDGETTTVTIEFHDKLGALKQLADYLGLARGEPADVFAQVLERLRDQLEGPGALDRLLAQLDAGDDDPGIIEGEAEPVAD